MKTKFIIFLSLFVLSCTHSAPSRDPSNLPQGTPDHALIFKRAREILIPKDKKLKNIPEHYVVDQLQDNPKLIQNLKDQLIKELTATVPANLDPANHTRLLPPPGLPGYSDLKIYINHPYYLGNKLVPASDLVKTWKDFIMGAEKEIILNVFDFDLHVIAEALIAKVAKGVQVRVGIDKNSVLAVREEVQTIRDYLVASGVHVTEVNSVALNHQKMMAIDWSLPSKARVLVSSGNLTKSCIEPEGDLKGTVPLPKESVPNANHFITMKSWILANLIQHELTKTLDPTYQIRGAQYPLNGSYQVTGPGVDPETLEAYPEPSLTISFTPGGGMKSINKNIIAHFLKQDTGRIRMMQFAYSSNAVDEALLFRAEQDYQQMKKFDFLSVGDTPFAMMDWSKFLHMSGFKLLRNDKKKQYVVDPENRWRKSLGEKLLKDVQSKVFIAPRIYGNNTAKVNGASKKVNAKIHHKVLATENFAILGTSFNFSEGAETNNEQILVFRDRKLADIVDGMVRYMKENSPGTVAQEVERRNKLGGVFDDVKEGPEIVP